MKKVLLSLLLLTCSISMSATVKEANDKDPIRKKVTWEAPAFPSNADGEIEKLYLSYYTPDGKRHDLVSDLPWPIEADTFVGGNIEEEDYNFDGIPDLQVSIGYLNNHSGYNAMYYWYVWNPKSHAFVAVDELLVNPEPVAKDKTVVTYTIFDGIINYTTYVWEGYQLKKIKEWSEELTLE